MGTPVPVLGSGSPAYGPRAPAVFSVFFDYWGLMASNGVSFIAVFPCFCYGIDIALMVRHENDLYCQARPRETRSRCHRVYLASKALRRLRDVNPARQEVDCNQPLTKDYILMNTETLATLIGECHAYSNLQSVPVSALVFAISKGWIRSDADLAVWTAYYTNGYFDVKVRTMFERINAEVAA